MVRTMTATEINREIEQIEPQERVKVRAFLTHLDRAKDQSHLASLDRKIERMQAGRGVGGDELRQLTAILEKAGE